MTPYFEPPGRKWDIEPCTLENFKPNDKQQEYALEFAKNLKLNSPIGLYVYGGSGTGKTHLLVGITRKLNHNKHANVSYVSGGKELWNELDNSTWAIESDNKLLQTEVLTIDDLTLDSGMKRESSLFYSLVNRIYDRGTLTLISSNYSPQDFVSQLDKRFLTELGSENIVRNKVLDRLKEMCLFVDFGGAQNKRPFLQEQYQRKYLNKKS